MKYIGAHVSTEGGVYNAVGNAADINAKAFALFVKNQRQWSAKPLDSSTIQKFKTAMKENKFAPKLVLPHAGYLINLGNPVKENRQKSIDSFIDEMNRCSALGLTCLNIHPGSHLNEISIDNCINLIAESLNISLNAVKDIKIIIENTAGQGSNIGSRFEEIAAIIEKVPDKKRIGVCLDTCHTFAAGYDIKTQEKYEDTMNKFGDLIGFENLSGIHLNDSKVPLASRKDRHESIGKGYLGLDFFKRFVNDNRFDNIPIILETIDETLWKEEIELLYSMIQKQLS
ncbi:MAG TPA: deoxyribonuclease IV [Lentisphaeria bacterium]|nr:MAG: deoxyribonuclease IV [Lentisphaerae bacterium GWF2_38_69]HBM16547.1 deoxyribonuclease IV [Lentisphaeria bacterium]